MSPSPVPLPTLGGVDEALLHLRTGGNGPDDYAVILDRKLERSEAIDLQTIE
jgi:hypothetical protein